MKSNKFRISEQDERFLLELWKWKLLTTTAIKHLSYCERSLYRTYVKLLSFEKQGLIQSVRSPNHDASVWQLNERGFNFIKYHFSKMRQEGYKSENKDHDFWVTAIHLGDWIKDVPKNCEVFTEQQLRRIESESFPDWVPSITDHRPDGWWSTGISKSRQQTLIALEVELSKKAPEDYSFVGDYYSRLVNPYQVVWVVKSKTDINYILTHLRAGSSTEAHEQSFIILDEYLKSQWQSRIIFGKNAGKTLSEILNKSNELTPNSGSGKVLLEISKKPIESRSPRFPLKAEIGLNRQI